MARATASDCKRLVRGPNPFVPLLECAAINGYAVGRKRAGGAETDDPAVILYVDRKVPLSRLALGDRLPGVIAVPDDEAEGGVLEFVTDVQEAKFRILALTSRLRPAPAGISIGHRDVTAGTLGGLLRDADTGELVILSNNHVLADGNRAGIGDPILQPGPADGGTDPADRIASLMGFVEIDFASEAENRVDAAIAAPLDPDDLRFETVDVGPETPTAVRALGVEDLGRFVHKTGRTTEHTQGYVQAVFGTVRVGFGMFRAATFVDQIIVTQSAAEEEFSGGGDSGSLVYDADDACVGLLFAGSPGAGDEPALTILNPIDAVLNNLGLELLEPGSHPAAEAVA